MHHWFCGILFTTASAVNTDMVHLDHCMMLINKWHALRLDLENKLFDLTGDSSIRDGSTETYKSDIFLGHCKDDGNSGYLMISGKMILLIVFKNYMAIRNYFRIAFRTVTP